MSNEQVERVALDNAADNHDRRRIERAQAKHGAIVSELADAHRTLYRAQENVKRLLPLEKRSWQAVLLAQSEAGVEL